MSVRVQVECKDCQEIHNLEVSDEGWKEWQEGNRHIQDALPELSAAQRELLLTRICGNCFAAIFSGPEY